MYVKTLHRMRKTATQCTGLITEGSQHGKQSKGYFIPRYVQAVRNRKVKPGKGKKIRI
jgi:hypothetical protein